MRYGFHTLLHLKNFYLQIVGVYDRKHRLFANKNFLNEEEYESHISFIKSQDELLDFNNRTCEVRNWLNYIRN